MILKLKQKLLRFRSEVHMGRYEKALKQGQVILGMLNILDESKIDLHEDRALLLNIAQQLKLVSQIQKMIIGQSDMSQVKQHSGRKKQNNEGTRDINPSIMNNLSQANQMGNVIGKWNKKKQTRQSPEKAQKIKTSSKGFIGSNVGLAQSIQFHDKYQQRKKQQMIQNALDEDQCQILQRQVILPINLPSFFKNKQAHRLIICYYEKCNNVIKKLTSQLTQKKKIIQVEQLSVTRPFQHPELRIYICPLQNNKERQICQFLDDPNNILVFYSDKNRQLMTQKQSNLRKEGYQLKF